ncbi:phosphate ABC transporter membrane protein 2 (PhoT family) [Hydrogenispora ethanolica]|jgi:phosphate transport system permease protein|uniref:Phosphate transport system permease protein PstA n=1 Tax=Hydrogenispora ethanolica TaxID=1082276 RepID=A0A4R1RVG6_HYDET|nr:phosphate ABC transporter permease PstA [Hydrogenispora ethanolica]TCL70100.1 phosphate ABC transporter membrane protein 2 (PhoT family) [Hydrogenispora ethanolica]
MRLVAKISQIAAFALLWSTAVLVIGCLLLIIGFILREGLPSVNWEFLSGYPEAMGREGGIFPTIVASLYLTLVSLLIAAPVGVGSAIYLVEYTRENWATKVIRFATETLAGVPSIIFGLFGFAFLVIFLHLGFSILSGAITLAIMLLPTIIRTSEEALKTVPNSYREGSLALGATQWVTIIKVVVPAALPGIVTGIVLSIGRAIGETAAVWLTVGGALRLPISVMDSARPMTLHLYTLAAEGLSLPRAYATASVLIIAIWIVNTVASFLMSRFSLRLKA